MVVLVVHKGSLEVPSCTDKACDAETKDPEERLPWINKEELLQDPLSLDNIFLQGGQSMHIYLYIYNQEHGPRVFVPSPLDIIVFSHEGHLMYIHI